MNISFEVRGTDGPGGRTTVRLDGHEVSGDRGSMPSALSQAAADAYWAATPLGEDTRTGTLTISAEVV